MPDLPISLLPVNAPGTLAATDVMPVVHSGVTERVTMADVWIRKTAATGTITATAANGD